MDTIYRFKITLKHTKPVIWRRFAVRNTITLPKLHRVIQIVMGWEDDHLHEFSLGHDQRYGKVDPEWGSDGMQNEARVKLNTLLAHEKDKLTYMYDFGDSWEHTLVLEKILPGDSMDLPHPECLAGELACPPEDCGGIPGYYDLIEVLSNPEHSDYEDMKEWIGEDFNPEYFDIKDVNQHLAQLKK